MFSRYYLQNVCSEGREALSFEFGVTHFQLPCTGIEPKRNIKILVRIEQGDSGPYVSRLRGIAE